jgi:hypothetical protein
MKAIKKEEDEGTEEEILDAKKRRQLQSNLAKKKRIKEKLHN